MKKLEKITIENFDIETLKEQATKAAESKGLIAREFDFDLQDIHKLKIGWSFSKNDGLKLDLSDPEIRERVDGFEFKICETQDKKTIITIMTSELANFYEKEDKTEARLKAFLKQIQKENETVLIALQDLDGQMIEGEWPLWIKLFAPLMNLQLSLDNYDLEMTNELLNDLILLDDDKVSLKSLREKYKGKLRSQEIQETLAKLT